MGLGSHSVMAASVAVPHFRVETIRLMTDFAPTGDPRILNGEFCVGLNLRALFAKGYHMPDDILRKQESPGFKKLRPSLHGFVPPIPNIYSQIANGKRE